jgi:hypothetical protein
MSLFDRLYGLGAATRISIGTPSSSIDTRRPRRSQPQNLQEQNLSNALAAELSGQIGVIMIIRRSSRQWPFTFRTCDLAAIFRLARRYTGQNRKRKRASLLSGSTPRPLCGRRSPEDRCLLRPPLEVLCQVQPAQQSQRGYHAGLSSSLQTLHGFRFHREASCSHPRLSILPARRGIPGRTRLNLTVPARGIGKREEIPSPRGFCRSELIGASEIVNQRFAHTSDFLKTRKPLSGRESKIHKFECAFERPPGIIRVILGAPP